MNETIKMGNDEFILYVRKQNKGCKLTTPVLGKRIWEWIRENDLNAQESPYPEPCLWGEYINEEVVDKLQLPKTATQFEFRIDLLPDLYKFLTNIKK